MSAPAVSVVDWLCPGCDAEPPSPVSEPVCLACGARLLEVRAQVDELVGQVIDGRYEIRDRLGQGGMGTVYRGWQRSIGREVAIKVIDDRHSRDPMAVRRFLREARLASRLSQPNTVSVHDFGQSSDGRLYIAMELIRGKTLADLLELDGRFSVARAAWIGVQLCDALDAAHRLHIAHRDLKPANIIVLDDPPGRDLLKVLDFGLAKSLTESETKATDVGLVVGTPRYMAPEILLGESSTPSADLYAVGVILGELTAGRVLWDATAFAALTAQKLAPSAVLGEIPAVLRALVARLISPNPVDRFPTASQVRSALRPLVGDHEAIVLVGAPAALDAAAATQVANAVPAHSAPRLSAALRPTERPPLGVPTAAGVPPLASLGPPSMPELAAPSRPASAASSISLVSAAVPSPPSGVVVASPPSWELPAAVPGPRRSLLALVLAVSIVAVAGFIAVDVMRGRRAPKARMGAVTAPTAADQPVVAVTDPPVIAPPDIITSPPVEIVLRIVSKPPGARISIAGVDHGRAPATVRVAAGDAGLVVEAALGTRTGRRSVVPDRDRTVEIALPRANPPPVADNRPLPF